MKRLHSYMLGSFIGPFFVTFFICVFVLLMQFLWSYLDEFVGKGLELIIIAELMLYAVSSLVPLAFPLAVLLASIMTFGSLGENNELLSMKAAGISLFRIMKPLVYLGVFLSLLAFYFATNILPVTNQKFGALLLSIRQQRPELVVKEGIFTNEIDGFSIKVGKKSKKSDKLYDIMIYDHRDNQGNVNVTVADSGTMKITPDKSAMILTLYSGETYTDPETQKGRRKKKSYPFRHETFSQQTLITQLQGMDFKRKDESSTRNWYKMLSLKQLEHNADSLTGDLNKRRNDFSAKLNYISPLTRKVIFLTREDSVKSPQYEMERTLDLDSIMTSLNTTTKIEIIQHAQKNARTNLRSIKQAKDDIGVRSKWLNKHWIEWHRKFTLSFACLVFFFIGAPLGAIIRKGGLGMPLVISILLFIFYYIVSMTGEKFAREGVTPAWEGMWFSTLVFLPAGIFLTYKAAHDSVILNIDIYLNFFKKINIFRKKKDTENEGVDIEKQDIESLVKEGN